MYKAMQSVGNLEYRCSAYLSASFDSYLIHDTVSDVSDI